ncbi:hypothetical protein AGMMS49928_08600 [Spirochaetia bacterium]|nr:hypothetical protein AGMMS49928_08600 [Spirochaetia bacterium]
MIRPRKMKQVELTVLSRDVDQVLEHLGRRALIHLSTDDKRFPGAVEPGEGSDEEIFEGETPEREEEALVTGPDEFAALRIKENLERLKAGAAWLGVTLPTEPEETSQLPGEQEGLLTAKISNGITALTGRESAEIQEKKKVEEALNEARSFASLNAPFSELDQLSYLTLRVGRLDPRQQAEMREHLADRAVIIPLGGDRVLAAASRKGRFALDSELKKGDFSPITIPEGYKGVPEELLSGLEERLGAVEKNLEKLAEEKKIFRDEYGPVLCSLTASYLMAAIVEDLKGRLAATKSVFLLSGWIPADAVGALAAELEKLTEGRVAIRTFNPEELPKIAAGKEKVPVSLKHGSFVRGFEGVVFSYGSPLYGTIDPTPFVAVFFTILFGLMFGDLGQGFVLLLLGFLGSRRGPKIFAGLKKYSSPLIAVGIASMVMGLLTGEIFTNEEILVGPTRFVTELITGHPHDHILHLMPEKGNIARLFYFFGFTIAVGVILNSIGLWVNVVNQISRKKYEQAFFSKTGLAGILLFWYALFIAIRCITGGSFVPADFAGLLIPVLAIFFGPVIWRIISGERPVLEHGLMVFIMEGFVEVLETASTFISNTVSFLRVGAFALSHAVLSFIVFTLSGMVAHLSGGPVFSFVILIFGNAVIILLEGMIVAIQVVRLQYYEFFSKFFTETGVEFSPFRFRKEVKS